MADEELDDIIYTITSGFYPQLFASKGPKFDNNSFIKGKGSVGARSAQVKGWAGKKSFSISKDKKATVNDDLIDDPAAEEFFKNLKGGTAKQATKRDRGKKQANQRDSFRIRWNKATGTLRDKLLASSKGSKGWKANIDIDDTAPAGSAGPLRPSQKEMEENLTYTKFRGNTNLYKIWGSRIWYQHGTQDKKKIEEGLNEWMMHDKKVSAAYLNTLYSTAEPDLVKLAMSMAEEIFGKSIASDNLREDIESPKDKPDVAEENWSVTKDFEEVDSMMDKNEGDLRKLSMARQLDVKLRMENGTSIYMDSTEMPITKANQHGLIEENMGDMKKLVDAAKEGGKGALQALKQGVITMFIKNTKAYNITFSKIYKKATEGLDKSVTGKKAILKWMKELKDENLKKGKQDGSAAVREKKARVTVANIGNKIFNKQKQTVAETTSLKYSVHMMMNMMGDAANNYRQGHYVGQIMGVDGKKHRAFASIPLGFSWTEGPEMLYDASPHQKDTRIVMGPSHALAYREEMNKNTSSARTKETHAKQVQSYTKGKMMAGVRASKTTELAVHADLTNRMSVRNPTRVTYNPVALKKKLTDIGLHINKNIEKSEFAKNAEKALNKTKLHQLSDQKGLTSKSDTKFWALPYIGIQEFSESRK